MRSILLGLGGGGRDARPARAAGQAHAPVGRHRFVQDGEVPVVRLSLARQDGRDPPRPAEPAAVDASEARLARVAAERLHQEATAVLHGVQTRLGHAELALQDALRQLQVHHEDAASLRAALRNSAEERDAAFQARDSAEKRCCILEEQLGAALGGDGRSVKREGRILASSRRGEGASDLGQIMSFNDDPEPVKWWRD